MNKNPRKKTIALIIIGVILNIIGLFLFIYSVYIANNYGMFSYLYSISNDFAFLFIIFYLIAYFQINSEKEYYTNKYAALFMIFFPIHAYVMLVIYTKAYLNILPSITIMASTVFFVIISLLYVFDNSAYNPLTKETLFIDKSIKRSQIFNGTLVLIYAFSLVINYILIELEEAVIYLSAIIYLIFIIFLIVYMTLFIVSFIKLKKEE